MLMGWVDKPAYPAADQCVKALPKWLRYYKEQATPPRPGRDPAQGQDPEGNMNETLRTHT